MYALCLDIGTSSLKGAVISSEGKLVSDGRIYYKEGVVWQQALKELVQKLDRTFSISAVCVSGSGPTFIPLKNDNTIGTPLFWNDKKEKPLAYGQSLYLPKLVWLKENQPAEYEGTKLFLTMDGYFNWLLTGVAAAPVFDDRFVPFFWDKENAAGNGIDFEKLPPLVHTGEKIGTVTKEAEEQFGIKAGTPLFAGGSDFLMAILGTATLKAGQICDRAGTSEGINYCCAGEKTVNGPELRVMPHITLGCTNISVRLPESAHLIETDREQYSRSLCRLLQALEREGCAAEALRLSGGQAKNAEWNQLRANMTGKRVLVPEIEDGELAGCACAAFAGLGLYGSPAQAAEAIVRIAREYTPE
jgi:xylulokinase